MRGKKSTSGSFLLERLLAGDSSAASWREFLTRYSNLFLKIIWQFEKDRDAVMEMYLRICSKLAENEFKVLQKFRLGSGLAETDFSMWLGAVVRNMCIDAYRARRGRKRLPRAVSKLPPLDREVFVLYYWKGYTVEETEHFLKGRMNGRIPDCAAAVARIERALTRAVAPRHLRQPAKPVPFEESLYQPVEENDILDVSRVEGWLGVLPPIDRLVVRLRFWEDMSLSEIAKLLEITPGRKIYTILQNALKLMRTAAEREARG